MRKRLISQAVPSPGLSDQVCLNVERVASLEVTSEEEGHPVESVLRGDDKGVGVQLAPGPRL